MEAVAAASTTVLRIACRSRQYFATVAVLVMVPVGLGVMRAGPRDEQLRLDGSVTVANVAKVLTGLLEAEPDLERRRLP